MGLETATYVSGLNSANPTSTDPKSQGDDHLRLLKSTLQATFLNADGAKTFPTGAMTVVGLATTQTLTNKTLTLPTITSIDNGGTITIPSGAGTFCKIAATQTLTNKTINLTNNTLQTTLAQLNTAISDANVQPTASPTFTGTLKSGVLHAQGSSSGATASISADDLIAETSGDSGLTILTGTTSKGSIFFGDSGDNAAGRIRYDHAIDQLEFWGSGGNGLIIDSSRRVHTAAVTDAVGAEAGSTSINCGDSGVSSINGNADELIVENNTNAGITIAAPATAAGALLFADPGDDDAGGISYNHNTDTMTIRAAAADAISITSARIDAALPVQLPSYTVAGLPTGAVGDMVYCSNGDTGSPCLAVYNGSNWVRVVFGATVSAT